MTITEPATAPAWATERIEHHDDGTSTEHTAVVGHLEDLAGDPADDWRVELSAMTGTSTDSSTMVRLVNPADHGDTHAWMGTPREALELGVLLIQAAGIAGPA